MVLTVTFLFNLMCALVPCDYIHPHPTAPPNFSKRRDEFNKGPDKRSLEINSSITSFERLEPVVFTKSGALKGYFMTVSNGKQIYSFEGIPYAEPPTGVNRFRVRTFYNY